jgi:class 3 adenylate cyclase
VDVQQVAALEGKVLSWLGSASETAPVTALAVPEPDAERRQLTVMFCDLVGSTDLSQRLDPEDLRSVVRAYQEAAARVIERYAGHVAQYLGDGLLVYFGHPQAHEDDAERAVRAGLEILAALRTLNDTLEPKHGVRLAARVGIHTGPVVIGAMGGGAKSETLALGDTTNIAARLEAAAAPDSVVISGATQRLVPGMFLLEDLGTPPLKGVATPVRAYAALQPSGVRSRLDVAAGRLTRFVGREVELATLVDRWERAADGEGQNVVVLGEAGVGKSRLIYQLHAHLAAVPHTWLECGATPYTEGTPFHPIIALVAQGLAFAPEDTAAEKLTKVETGLGALASAETVALLADFLGLPPPTRLQLSPELQRRKTIDLLAQWNLALSEAQPLVLFVEDLHWCDASTLELLGHVIAQSPTARVLLLATARPEFAPPWPARSNLTTVQLARLTKRQARDMIATLAGSEFPAATLDALVARADGVP